MGPTKLGHSICRPQSPPQRVLTTEAHLEGETPMTNDGTDLAARTAEERSPQGPDHVVGGEAVSQQ